MSDVPSESDGVMCRTRSAVAARPYDVDMFVELKKYWMVCGVLVSVALAVLAPGLGAPGGLLQVEYTRYLPLCYVWYAAGRGARTAGAVPSRRVLALAAAHAALVVPALALGLLAPLRPPATRTPLADAGVSTWLSVALCEDEAAAAVTLVAYLAALLVTPLATYTLEGSAALPALGAALGSGVPAAGAYCAGAWRGGGGGGGGRTGRGVAALALLYAQCCAGVSATRGPAEVGALAGSAAREAGWWAASAALCWAYAAGGGGGREARLLAGCAVPRGLDAAAAWGAAPVLPSHPVAVLRPPAAALLLAALAAHTRPPPPPPLDHLPR